MESTLQAILKTLIYSNIFQYPLTKEELWKYLITKKEIQKRDFLLGLQKTKYIQCKKNYFFLKGSYACIEKRIVREQYYNRKIVIARRISSILEKIPFVLFIGVTGSLAMKNATEQDDIDLFVITTNNTVWITRILILILLQVLGKRRKKGDIHVNNKLCVNLLIEESQLSSFSLSPNLYTAHEIAQIQPLCNYNGVFERMREENRWIKTYLPHVFDEEKREKKKEKKTIENWLILQSISLINAVAKTFQLWYMKQQVNSAKITDTVLAFYPTTTKNHVLQSYEEQLEVYHIRADV